MPQNGNESPMAVSHSSPSHSPKKEAESENTTTKLCHIVKRPDFEGYGFNLHSEKSKPGQFIGKVDANSPAELAGLKEGDRIVEVNGVPIGNETHKQVVQRIKALSCEVRLLLIDVDKLNSVDFSSVVSQAATQKIPGSANISSISMTSTKRVSETTQTAYTYKTEREKLEASNQIGDKMQHDIVVTSNQIKNGTNQESFNEITNHNNLNVNATPPPPSSNTATVAALKNNNNNGSLQLPTTAAEMRAKLLSKKKYDPKNEGVDLKKKFEIIQKL